MFLSKNIKNEVNNTAKYDISDVNKSVKGSSTYLCVKVMYVDIIKLLVERSELKGHKDIIHARHVAKTPSGQNRCSNNHIGSIKYG